MVFICLSFALFLTLVQYKLKVLCINLKNSAFKCNYIPNLFSIKLIPNCLYNLQTFIFHHRNY